MNVTLKDVYQTSADGERFWKMKEMFIKGNVVGLLSLFLFFPQPTHSRAQIKYFRIADAVLDQAAEEQEKQRALGRQRGGARGGRGGPPGRGELS